MPSDKHVNRVQRIEKEVKQCLASLVINHYQRNWSGVITVSRVKMPSDLRSAKIYVSFFGDENQKNDVLETLNKEAKFLQGEVTHALKLRYCPIMTFEWDLSYENSLKIDKILHEISEK